MTVSVHTLIEQLLHDNWIDTDIAWENVIYKPVRGEPFICPKFDAQDAEELGGISNKVKTRITGTLTVECYESITLGSRGAYKMASKVADIFRGFDDNGVFFYGPYVIRRGQTEEWFNVDMIVSFEEDECTLLGAGYGLYGYGSHYYGGKK